MTGQRQAEAVRQHALGTRLTDLPLLPDHSGTALEARR